MELDKQGTNIPFGQGIDTKTDPFQVPAGKLLALTNAVFETGTTLQKRNGFQKLTSIEGNARSLTTYNGGLIAIGSTLQAFSAANNQWLPKGDLPSVELRVTEAARTANSQICADMGVSAAGLTCVVYEDSSGSYYQILDNVSNEVVIAPVALPSTSQRPRVFVMPSWFIVTFTQTVTGTPHLRYIALPINNPANPSAAADISTSLKSVTAGYDAVVANNALYLAWYGADLGNAVRVTYMTNQLTVASPKIITGAIGDIRFGS